MGNQPAIDSTIGNSCQQQTSLLSASAAAEREEEEEEGRWSVLGRTNFLVNVSFSSISIDLDHSGINWDQPLN